MQLNFKHIKLGLTVTIITLILIGTYSLTEKNDDGQGAHALEQPDEQPQTMAKDPFKEHIDKQQLVGAAQPSPAQLMQSVQVMNGKSPVTIPVGIDPFKAFLESQRKVKPEEAGISPFESSK
jgi:hypothetical protein